MIQSERDILVRQAQQLGRVLGVILAKLLGTDRRIQEEATFLATNEILKEELNFDINDLLHIPADDFIRTLQFNLHFNDSSLESMAEILFLTGDAEKNPLKRVLFERSLLLYDYLQSRSEKTFSFSRIGKIDKIRKELSKGNE